MMFLFGGVRIEVTMEEITKNEKSKLSTDCVASIVNSGFGSKLSLG